MKMNRRALVAGVMAAGVGDHAPVRSLAQVLQPTGYTFGIADVMVRVNGTYYAVATTNSGQFGGGPWELCVIRGSFSNAIVMVTTGTEDLDEYLAWMADDLEYNFPGYEIVDQKRSDGAADILFTQHANGQTTVGYWRYRAQGVGGAHLMERYVSYVPNFVPDLELLQKDVTVNNRPILSDIVPGDLASRFGDVLADVEESRTRTVGKLTDSSWKGPENDAVIGWDPLSWSFASNVPDSMLSGDGVDQILLGTAADQTLVWVSTSRLTDMSEWERRWNDVDVVKSMLPNAFSLVDMHSSEEAVGILYDTTALNGVSVVAFWSAVRVDDDLVASVRFWAPPYSMADRVRDVREGITVNGEPFPLAYTPEEVDDALSSMSDGTVWQRPTL